MSEFNTGNDTYYDGKFILLYNQYYAEYDPQQLTPKELQTLIILKEYASNLNGINITTYNLMGYLLPFTNVSEKKKNAAIARDIMQSLKRKNIVEYDEPKDANESIIVKIEQIKYIEGNMRTTFQPVPEFILKRTNDPDELYVLVTIHSIAKACEKGDYSKPFFRNKKNWGGLLGKGNITAEKVVNKMCDKGLVFYYENDVNYDQEGKRFTQGQGKYYLFAQEHEEERIKLRDQRRAEYKKNAVR